MLLGLGVFRKLKLSQLASLSTWSSTRSLASSALSIAAIKELREKSGAPIAEVKAALEEAEYNQEQAYQVLRKRGLAAATRKTSRRAAEGLVGLARIHGTSAALVEVNSETDFAARNEGFQRLVSDAAQAALRVDAPAQTGPSGFEIPRQLLGDQPTESGLRLEDLVQEFSGSAREHIRLRRAFRLDAPLGAVGSYMHASLASGLGRIGCLVAIEATSEPIPLLHAPKVNEVGNLLAMHAAAARPLFLDREKVTEAALEGEKTILRAQAGKSGKPANIIEKMVLGRLNKFYEEVCFLEQSFIMDDALKVKDVVQQLSKEAGVSLAITGFVRIQCGEGLEEENRQDFAAEVQQTVQAAS